jgi:hypothetical protein
LGSRISRTPFFKRGFDLFFFDLSGQLNEGPKGAFAATVVVLANLLFPSLASLDRQNGIREVYAQVVLGKSRNFSFDYHLVLLFVNVDYGHLDPESLGGPPSTEMLRLLGINAPFVRLLLNSV